MLDPLIPLEGTHTPGYAAEHPQCEVTYRLFTIHGLHPQPSVSFWKGLQCDGSWPRGEKTRSLKQKTHPREWSLVISGPSLTRYIHTETPIFQNLFYSEKQQNTYRIVILGTLREAVPWRPHAKAGQGNRKADAKMPYYNVHLNWSYTAGAQLRLPLPLSEARHWGWTLRLSVLVTGTFIFRKMALLLPPSRISRSMSRWEEFNNMLSPRDEAFWLR